MNKLDWNIERYRTRDRLIEYDFNIYPAVPHSAGLNIIYPWENIAISQLKAQFIEIVRSNGYVGDEIELWEKFSDGVIKTGTLNTFPIPGDKNNLYLDIETDILYYFKIIQGTISPELIEKTGLVIVGQSEIENTSIIENYVYIPIKAMSIEESLFEP